MTNIILETSHGDIEIELNDAKAPVTVKSILTYVRDGFYDGTVFHRVIKGFMVQGGGFDEQMVQKQTGKPIKNEADNKLLNDRGTVAMARTSDPNSATAQFFINHKDNHFLNYSAPTTQGWGYCVFGKVVNGMDVVDTIANVSTSNSGGHADVPTDAVTIKSARVA